MPTPHPSPRAFSMIELVIVVVIIGIVAAIAVPRLGNAAQNSQASALKANLKTLSTAVELYVAEHNNLTPAQSPDGSADSDANNFLKRLCSKTANDGTGNGAAIFGPYLRSIPNNPANTLNTLRIDGAPAGVNTHGWRYDSATRVFQADDSIAAAAITIEAGAAIALGNP
jgi:prepilin-type N-terminal cleavage/methylation domain-containing protein